VDESGATLAMSRRYGRAIPGHRVVDHVPANYGINYTMLAALGRDGLEAPWVVDGAVNGDIFRWWVRHVLCPTLQPGDIVRWDNPTTSLTYKRLKMKERRHCLGQVLSQFSPSNLWNFKGFLILCIANT
jgi:DDE superfamily endonuclease